MSRHRPDRTKCGSFATLLAAACAVAAVGAAPAAADSLTFIKDNNVWLANPDGSGRYQVTFDGTPGAPYESPSQCDAGTVVAIRQTPGQRRQIYRMSQSGGLLNAPINTPAPGTGAIDGKVSPDGALVAYWFATTVNDPICVFCVNASERALLSHSERFTGADEVGTPNGGGRPSWLNNKTITLGSGSATQYYYTLGMPEEQRWFNDGLFTSSGFQTLLDAEVAPTGDRLAVVRGNHQETIRFLTMSGPPPDAPTPVTGCWFANPSGKFVSPTWTSDGHQLAWQEDDGVWLGNPGDLMSCPLPQPRLVVAGGSEPDLSLAAISPGPRPGCGNPGNPAACPGPAPPPPPPPQPQPRCGNPGNPCQVPPSLASVVREALGRFGGSVASAFGRLKISGLLRKRQLTIAFTAPAAGTLTAALTASGASASRTTVIATGRRVYTAAGTAKLTIKLSAGSKRLRAVPLRGTLTASFAPQGGRAISTTSTIRLRR